VKKFSFISFIVKNFNTENVAEKMAGLSIGLFLWR